MKLSSIHFFGAAVLSLLLLAPLSRLDACMVCVADPMERVLVVELQASEEAVLARAIALGGGGKFQVSRVLKTATGIKQGKVVDAGLPLFSTDGGKMGRGIVLLTRRDENSDWIVRAPASGLHHVAFFQKVLALPPVKTGENAEKDNQRAEFFLRYLHHPDRVLARASAAEISGAPYTALKAMEGKLDAAKIRSALNDPALGDRRALYYTLIGICGTAADAVSIRGTLDQMWKSNGSKNLAALLTAWLELEGEAAVEELEARYFRDRSRTLPEVEAAVMALRVHGNTDATISRKRAIEAYRTFFTDREPLVFYIAADLARWEDWESKDRLVEIAAQRGDALPEIRQRVNEYLDLYSKKSVSNTP